MYNNIEALLVSGAAMESTWGTGIKLRSYI